METVSTLLLSAFVFGLSSGMAPGPTLTLTISETLRHGPWAGIKVALAPLVTDGPIILFSWLVLAGMGNSQIILGLIAILGAGVLFYFAWECMVVKPVAVVLLDVPEKALRKGVITNLFNPGPYLFWVSVGTPTLLRGNDLGTGVAIAFLAIFFLTLVSSKASVAMITSRFRGFLSGKLYLGIMRLMGLCLAFFAVLFLYKAGVFLGLLN